MRQDEVHRKRELIAVGLNPAWQKTLCFPEFIPGGVNRASSVSLFPAGKGINFARAASIWGAKAIVCQFLGGCTGKLVKDGLRNERISHISVELKSPVRTCTTCICVKTGEVTELIEPSAEVPSNSVRALKKKILEKIPSCAGIALCGTYPGGVGADFYADIASAGRKHGKLVMLDGFKGIEGTLERGISVLKVNRSEFCTLTGETDIFDAARTFFSRYDVRFTAITAGPSKAYVFERDGVCEYKIPCCGKILNPIGAGDTVSAVLLAELARGAMPADAFRLALGAGTASCFNLKSADFSTAQARKFSDRIRIVKKRY
ncbi:MAG: PfkB family carbohydrate kinase [Victivallales bacterium]